MCVVGVGVANIIGGKGQKSEEGYCIHYRHHVYSDPTTKCYLCPEIA